MSHLWRKSEEERLGQKGQKETGWRKGSTYDREKDVQQ